MAYNQHPDDQPPASWKEETTESEAQEAYLAATEDPAFQLGILFCSLLAEEDVTAHELSQLVTPESLPAWGDFQEIVDWFKSLKDVGYGTIADRALGDESVAYFKVIGGTTESYKVVDAQPISTAAIVTLVQRPELGGWRVHGIGNSIRPEEVPH